MIPRAITPALTALAQYYPVVVVTGPRQSGKITLCKAAFPDHAYLSLEALDAREFANSDPRGLLAQYKRGVVLDEVQHAPALLSYLQEEVDRDATPGRFVLTGSQHFSVGAAVAQSLAGRAGVLTLLPPAFSELRAFANAPETLADALFMGAYPRIFDRSIPPERWLADYLTTYVQRDVRQVLNVGNLEQFSTFLRLCAGHTAQEVNLAQLGAKAGVSHNTARAWLSVLEASFIIQRLPAWHPNVRKQVVKAPKMHFIDAGLACHLLGIRSAEQAWTHPLRGALFESWAVAEVLKGYLNQGTTPHLLHYREARGVEIDLLVEHAGDIDAIEMKSGATLASDWLLPFARVQARLSGIDQGKQLRSHLLYGGSDRHVRGGCEVLPWRDVGALVHMQM